VREFAVYTLARVGLFVASYAVVAGVYVLVTGSREVPLLWPFVVAIVMSAVASFYLLGGMRDRFAAVVERRAAAASRRFEAARSKEDVEDR
jgi:hypothetical protein